MEILSGYGIVDNGRFYLYRYIRQDKDEPFYVGLGTKNKDDLKYGTYARANNKHYNNDILENIIKSVKYEIEIILETDSYPFIKEKEKEFIKLYGRINRNTGTLANKTDGGQGRLNAICTEETRQKLIESHKGKRLSPESQAKRIATLKRKYKLNPPKVSEEHKEKLRNYQLGNKQSEETIGKRIAKITKAKEEFKNGNLQVKTGAAKGIINNITGEIFPSIIAAAESIGMKQKTLSAHLTGQMKNKTPFTYIKL